MIPPTSTSRDVESLNDELEAGVTPTFDIRNPTFDIHLSY